jgi:hypothetical protein
MVTRRVRDLPINSVPKFRLGGVTFNVPATGAIVGVGDAVAVGVRVAVVVGVLVGVAVAVAVRVAL